MKKTIYFCDKCGAEIEDVAYTITCYADDVLQSFDGTVSSEVAMQNMRQNMARLEQSKILCSKCKDAITDGIFIL